MLRATPNPFQGDDKMAYLPLSIETPLQGKAVLADSLMSPDVENVRSEDVPQEDFSRGEVLGYQFHQEDGALQSELLLFSQEIVAGQSGSPLVSSDSQGVVGVIVGRWLRPTVIPSSAKGSGVILAPGAAPRIHYAISLLQQQHILWHPASKSLELLHATAQPAPVQAAQETAPQAAPQAAPQNEGFYASCSSFRGRRPLSASGASWRRGPARCAGGFRRKARGRESGRWKLPLPRNGARRRAHVDIHAS